MSTLYSVGQMNQLADALEAAGYTPDDVTKLRSKPDALKEFKDVLAGLSEFVITKHLIDCDVDPFVPKGWKVEEHIKGGQFEWDPTKVDLYLSEKQRGGSIEGNKLRQELRGRSVLNANVLDYLLAHPNLIPEEWKGKYVFFWGTIYRYSAGDSYVRYLCFGGCRWHWSYGWLGSGWGGGSPTALRAS